MAPFDETLFLKNSVEVLSFFNEDQLRKVTPDIERDSYRKGQSVLMRGEISGAFYVVKSGRAEAVYKLKGRLTTVELKPGDFFGELSLVEDMPSDAAIKAADDDTVVMRIPSASFRKLLEMQPLLKTRLLERIAQRRAALAAPKA